MTVQIGGNDIGFGSIATDCWSPTPTGHPCQDKFVINGRDTILDRVNAAAPKVAAVFQGIHQRSPNARVYALNYPAIFPTPATGCSATR